MIKIVNLANKENKVRGDKMSRCCSNIPKKQPAAPLAQCTCKKAIPPRLPSKLMGVDKVRYFGIGIILLAIWCALYFTISPLSQWVVYDLFSIREGTPLGGSLEFFFYDSSKILLLLVLMVYVISWLRAGMHVERVRDYLAGKGRGVGYVLGAGLGALTPFCSCSSIPLFLSFIMARIPLGITMSFLITSPLINEIAIVLLWDLLGWKFTIIYVAVGVFAGILSGIVMDAIHAKRWLRPSLLGTMRNISTQADKNLKMSLMARHAFAYSEMTSTVHKVWRWILIGVGLGALLHGFVPQEWFTKNFGTSQWWSVPVAVAVGIPLYTNVTGVIPVMESLLIKGLPLGTTLAFCMSTVAVSLPEIFMLRQAMQWKLITVFLFILIAIFIFIGFLFNAIRI